MTQEAFEIILEILDNNRFCFESFDMNFRRSMNRECIVCLEGYSYVITRRGYFVATVNNLKRVTSGTNIRRIIELEIFMKNMPAIVREEIIFNLDKLK